MGAQLSIWSISPAWRRWLEERCSLELLRSIYKDFRVLLLSREGNEEKDPFFISAEDFRQVFADVAGFPSVGQGRRGLVDHLGRRKQLPPDDSERSRRMHLDACFSCFDVLGRGRVPSGVVWGGLALMTGASDLIKIKFIFSMYDIDRDGMVNQTELHMAISACSTGYCRLHGSGPPSDSTLLSLTKEAFLHQAAVEAALEAKPTKVDGACYAIGGGGFSTTTTLEASPSKAETTPTSSNNGGGSTSVGVRQDVAKALTADAVASFCRANTLCRNFMKRAEGSGSVDLVVLYQQEHELLRELAQVDGDLDKHRNRAKADAAASAAYASQRGGDVKNFVIEEARMRALAGQWGVGRLLEPATIRDLLGKAQGFQDERAAAGDAPNVSSKGLPPIDSGIDDSGTDDSDGVIDGSRSNDSKDQKMPPGWAERSKSEPEVQLQLLCEVERLARAAARAEARGESKVSKLSTGAKPVEEAARALETQTNRRAARRAKKMQEAKDRARAAAEDLMSGAWKSTSSSSSAMFARDFTAVMSQKETQSVLNRGQGLASLTSTEMRIYREWETLKAQQESSDRSTRDAECANPRGDASTFATRLDVDTLEDLVESAGGFITDEEAKEALGPNGNLEKDQLNRVTIVNFIQWFQRREQSRVREEARLRNPSPPWKVRLEAWRKAWKKCVIGELAMMKRALHRRIARRADLTYNNDSRKSFASESDSGLRDNGIVQGCDARDISGLKSNKIPSQQCARWRKEGSKHPANLRPSRFTVSLIVPRPEQHTVLNTNTTGGSRDDAIRSDLTETQNATSSASNTKKAGVPAKGSVKNIAPSSRSSTIKPADQSGSSVIRLDIVREDAEREQGGPLSPRRDRSALDNKVGGEREGGGAEHVASARSDSTAKELLKWYTDEQNKRKELYWQEQGLARKKREEKAKIEGKTRRQIQEEEAEEDRNATKMAPRVREMRAVAWVDMPFLPTSPPQSQPTNNDRDPPQQEESANPSGSHRPPTTPQLSPGSPYGPGNESVGSGPRSRSSSIFSTLAMERDAVKDFQEADTAAAERLAREFRGFFNNIPRDYRNELGFADVLVSLVKIHYRAAQAAPGSNALNPSKRTIPSRPVAKTPSSSTSTKGPRRVLRVAFFWDEDSFQITPPDVNGASKGEPEIALHLLEDLVFKISVQLDLTASMAEILEAMAPWKNFHKRLYGPQEDELLEECKDPRTYARSVVQEIQATSTLLDEIPGSSFEQLRLILKGHGLSDVGTLSELIPRTVKLLEGKIKATAEGGALSKFGDRAARILFRKADKDRDGCLSFSEMTGMLRRMGTRALHSAMANEVDYLRALKEMGVQTKTNGFITEDGLVAFYRDFGRLGEDIEASGVASLSDLLGLKLSAVGQIDSLAAERLETLLMEEHPRLGRLEKALVFFLRFARDLHLECFAESIGDWVAPMEKDLLRACLLGPGWISRAVERLQRWLADGDKGVIPNFREAAAAKLGERWASTPEDLYAPGGSTSSSLSSTVENRVPNGDRTNDTGQQERYPTTFRTTTPRADATATISRTDNPVRAHPVVAFAPAFGTSDSTNDHAEGVVGDVVSQGRGGKVRTAHDHRRRRSSDGTRSVSAMPKQGGSENVVDCVEAVEANRPVNSGVSKETPAASGDAEMYEEQEFDLPDVVVEAGSVREIEEAMEKTEALRAMLATGLPSKTETNLQHELKEVEGKAEAIKARLEAATAAAIARGLRAYDAARSRLEGVATVGVGTSRVTARLQITEFPIFSLLPAGIGEPSAGRFEEDAKNARAEMRRKAALDEIDRAKEQQRLEEEERKRKRIERLRRKREEQMKEEIDLYERGLCARQMARTRESEKAQAQGFWRRLVALRQRRSQGTPGAAVAVNNLGVLLVEQTGRDSVHAAEGRKLLKMAVDIAEAGLQTSKTEVGRGRNATQGNETTSTTGPEETSAWAGYSSKISPVPTDKTVPVLDQPVVDALSKPGKGRADADTTIISAVTLQEDAIKYGTKPDSARDETPNGCGFSPEIEWAAILALFSSNLFYAMEGPGRASDDGSLYEEEGVASKTESEQEDGNAGEDEKGHSSISITRCETLFSRLPKKVLSVASGPSDSWICAGVGVTLFEREDPFWWTRAHHTEDDEAHDRGVAGGQISGDGGKALALGARRRAIIRNRAGPGDGKNDEERRGGYTDLEVIEVLDPARAARIRLRQARKISQQKRQKSMIERRKETRRQLRRQDKEAEAALRIEAEGKVRDVSGKAIGSRKERQDTPVEQEGGHPLMVVKSEGRFVRAVGAIKALRARAFRRGERADEELGGF